MGRNWVILPYITAVICAVIPFAAFSEDSKPSNDAIDYRLASPDEILSPGAVELETGVDFWQDRTAGETSKGWGVPFAFTFGLSRSVNLEIDWEGFMHDKSGNESASGVGDATVGLRFDLPSDTLSHSFGAAVTIPGDDEFGSEDTGYSADWAWGVESRSGSYWYGGIGVARTTVVGETAGMTDEDWSLFYEANVDIPYGKRIFWTVSIEGDSPLSGGGGTALSASIGPSWTFPGSPAFDFGLSAGHGLNDQGGDWTFGVNLGFIWD